MSPPAALHAQLASIVEVLANAAVAEICALVDGGYAALQLEVSRSRKENEALRRKLRLAELRGAAAARATALRAAAATALLPHASGRARAQTPPARHRHQGNDPRRNRTPAAGDVASSRVTSHRETTHRETTHRETSPVTSAADESTDPTAAVIKVEDEDESWSQSEQDDCFRCVGEGQTTQTEAPPPPTKQEVADEGGDSSQTRKREDVSSTSVQNTLNGHQRAESGSYEFLMYEAQLQHGPHSTHNPRSEDPGCSYVLNSSVSSVSADAGGGGGSFNVSEASASEQPAVSTDSQQRAASSRDEPRRPVTGRRDDLVRRDRGRHRGGEDGGGKAFVCSYCGKSLTCLKNLKTHVRVHTGEKPFVCALCGKRFSDSSNLKRHQSVHTGEKRYGCAHCGKRFAQSGSLKVHMSVHTDCKQFRCSLCGRTFISSGHLRRHAAVHAGERRFAHTLH